jgi:hypothetical protein
LASERRSSGGSVFGTRSFSIVRSTSASARSYSARSVASLVSSSSCAPTTTRACDRRLSMITSASVNTNSASGTGTAFFGGFGSRSINRTTS